MKAKLKDNVKLGNMVTSEGKSDNLVESMLENAESYREVICADGYKTWFIFLKDNYKFHFHKSWLDFEKKKKE